MIRVIGLFADNMGLRKPLQKSGGYRLFRHNIRLGDEIDRRGLFGNRACVEIAEAGHDFLAAGSGNGGNQKVDIFIGKGHR